MKLAIGLIILLSAAPALSQSLGHYTRYPSTAGISTPVAIADGGTGSTSASTALTALGAQAAISATSPITFSSNTVAIPAATSLVDGYLGHGDWATFNAKQPTVSATSPITFASNTVAIPAATNSVNGYLTSADHTSFAAKAASGANSDITSLNGITRTGIVFKDAQTPTPNTVTISVPSTVTSNWTLTLPDSTSTQPQQPLCSGVAGGTLDWCDPLTGFISLPTLYSHLQNTSGAHPVAIAYCATNQDVTGGDGLCDGGDQGGGTVILAAQTDPTQNGLWKVNPFGAWTYDETWADQSGGCSGSDGYILSVNAGTSYGHTVWQVECVAGNATFVQIPVSSRSGTCTVSSTTLSTTATNLTCTGVPASTGVAVLCSGAAAFSTSAANGLYCRATGTANQIACNTMAANTTAMAYSCSWVKP